MGATTGDIVRLLVWQFIKPVLWANVIAWPIAGYLMSRWLRGFAYHVDLEPWLFLAASSLALLSAVLTVGVQSYLVARSKPITALRYE
jgi:putative ABC transport system permease protein